MLRLVLRMNAASCALFGAIFVLLSGWVADFLGTPPVPVLQVLGVGLLANAVALVWTSMRPAPDRMLVQAFAFGDLLWVVATLFILGGGIWVTTPAGISWAIGVALFVGACGALQWKHLPDQRRRAESTVK